MSSHDATEIKSEIEFLLSSALPEVNLNDYKIEIVGTSEKGDGFVGDIYFVNLTSKIKNYNFVLKCSKSSEALRKATQTNNTFANEIYIYTVVFPTFKRFEIERNINNVFDSIPKCYGTFTGQGKEVIVLQNLKSIGYQLWDKKLPFPRDYIETVLKLYGRWHAISAAMQYQEPENFEKLVNNLIDVWTNIDASINVGRIFLDGIEDIAKIWKNDMDEEILKEWQTLIDHTEFYIKNSRRKTKHFNVITHGDCWNNNFMFKVTSDKLQVAMLDWQIAAFTSPIVDLSYFLYCGISEEDLQDFDDLLKLYYTSFAEHLTRLGNNPEQVYSYTSFLDDWKRYGRIGIIHSILSFRMASVDKDDLPDMAKSADNGEDIKDAFYVVVKDQDYIKKRSKCILYHAVERGLIRPTHDF